MKYSEIKNIESLDGARRRLKVDIDAKRQELSRSAEALKDACTPSAVIASAVHAASSHIPFDRLAICAIRRLKSRL